MLADTRSSRRRSVVAKLSVATGIPRLGKGDGRVESQSGIDDSDE